VLVLVIAGGLFCRSMLGQIAADDDRAFAAAPKELEATTVSAGGLYELHTHCAKECRNRGDLTGAEWHERILARMRGEKVDDSVILGGGHFPTVGVVDSLRAGTLMREAAQHMGESND